MHKTSALAPSILGAFYICLHVMKSIHIVNLKDIRNNIKGMSHKPPYSQQTLKIREISYSAVAKFFKIIAFLV